MRSLIFNIDYNHQPVNIGDFVLHLLVCSLLLEKNKLDYVDVNIISDPNEGHPDDELRPLLLQSNKKRKIYDIIQMLQLLPRVRSITLHEKPVESIDRINSNIDTNNIYWPPLEKLLTHQYMYYEAVRVINQYIFENKTYPTLCFSEYQQNFALKFYRKHAYPHVPVTINLRNNPYFHSNRNAFLDEWKNFFTMAADTYPAKFIIISSYGEIDPEIAKLKNVVYAKQYCTSLVDDLSLLSNSAFHLGNPSGPSLLIYFTEKPYHVFNWQPCVAQYHEAIKANSATLQLAFATPLQSFGVVPETAVEIKCQFEKIWNSRDWLEWAFVDFYKRQLVEIPYWF